MQLTLASTITLLTSAGLMAETPTIDPRSPVTLLPEGSVLKDVLLPRYNAKRTLVGDLQAKTLTLLTGSNIEGKDVVIRFFEQDRTLKAKIAMTRVVFNQNASVLNATEPVTLEGPQITAKGSGLTYRFSSGNGFLRGPVTTELTPSEATSMNTRILTPAVLSSIAATSLVFAEKPRDVSAAELAEIKTMASSETATLQEMSASTQNALEREIEAGKSAAAAAKTFIQETQTRVNSPKATPSTPAAAPLKVTNQPGTTVIECQDGMFFNADEGVLVYMGNVRVQDPRFTLSGANQVKIFFSQPDPKADKDGETSTPAPDQGIAGNFGDVQRLLATGAVKILQKSMDGKEPVEASGAVLSYDISKGEIIISDGFPWVKQGKFFARAKEANLTLRLLNDGSFTTRGNWEMGGQLNLQGQ